MQSLFIISSNREVLIEKHWRKVTQRGVVDIFLDEVLRHDDPKDILPIIPTSSLVLINVYYNNIFLLCVVSREIAPLMVIEFLHCTIRTFVEYFKVVSERTIKENFTTVYQLLEEMCDNGFPLTTEKNILESMIAPPSIQNRIVAAVSGKSAVSEVLPEATAMGSIPWRRKLVHYNINSVYFDIVEKIDCIVDRNGQITNCQVHGELICTSNLSGVPDLLVSFQDPWVFSDYSLHPCVRIAQFSSSRSLAFVPPDGKFTLLSYTVHPKLYSSKSPSGDKVQYDVSLPVYCRPRFTFTEDGGNVDVMVGMRQMGPEDTGSGSITLSNITKRLSVATISDHRSKMTENVSVLIPFPSTSSSTDLKCNTGTIVSDEVRKVCTWTISKIDGEATPRLSGSFTTPTKQAPADEVVTLLLRFRVPNKTVSGISISGITCRGETYAPYKYVRTTIESGSVQIRCP